MNGMGGQPQNKLQAMLLGLQGNSPIQRQGPQTQGPTPANPNGMQQQTDPTASAFATMVKGLNGLGDMLLQLGDSITSTDVKQMAIDLQKLGQARQSDMLKKMQLEQKIGSPQPPQAQQPPQGMM